jgi:glycosyltransferase involved in cell wall biosynthesis
MKFSIIMPSLNQAAFLPQAVASVLSQTGPFDVQLLVIDGGSSDGSVQFLRGLNDPRLAWRSGPDRGQGDAVNKGLALATGDVIGWLNSDDRYAPGALAAVAEAFTAPLRAAGAKSASPSSESTDSGPGVQWLIGRCRIIDPAGLEIRHAVSRYKDRKLRCWASAVSRETLLGPLRGLLLENFISQMAVFWWRPFGQSIGPLDESLNYAMDYDLWLRMAQAAPPQVLDRVLAEFRVYPASKTGQASAAQFAEQYHVARRYMAPGWAGLRPRLTHRLQAGRALLGNKLLRLVGW